MEWAAAEWGLAIGLLSVFLFGQWEIDKLERRIEDLEADLAVRNENVFTEAQWTTINHRFNRILELMGERLPPA